ncbi:MAG: hypothetical protein WCG80_15170 [Spirochaetales bacterium]
MRTTLTLEDDISILLEQRVAEQKVSFKYAVNVALRRGLADEVHEKPPVAYSTPVVSLGRPLLTNLDRVAEVLAVVEGEGLADATRVGK